MRRTTVVALLSLGVLALAPPLAAGAMHQIVAYDNFWQPSILTVRPGDDVTFWYGGSRSNMHTWQSAEGGPFCDLPCVRAYPAEGTFGFRCPVHTTMTGEVRVTYPASVSIASPQPQDVLTGVVAVTGTASHATKSITRVDVRVDAGSYAAAALSGSGTSVGFSHNLNTASFADGARDVGVRVTTAGGFTDEWVVPVVFHNRPSVAVLSPPAGTTLSGVATLGGTATSPGQALAKVEVRVDGVLRPATLGGSGTSVSWSYDFDTLGVANGPVTLGVRATTTGNLWTEPSVSYVVDSPPFVDLRVASFPAAAGNVFHVPVTVLLRNDGNVASPAFQGLLEYEHKGVWKPILTFAHGPLAAKSERSSTFLWENPGGHVGRFPVRVVLDPSDAIAESLESNNVGLGSATFQLAVDGIDLRDP